MKAALLESPGKMTVREIDTPAVRSGTILLRVRSCGICGTDMRFYNYGDRVKEFPAILGHEIAGEVAEVGVDVKGFAIGDRIALGNEIPCKKCAACSKGLENVCENRLSIGSTLPGGLSEYMLLTEDMVGRGPINNMPSKLSFDEAALAEPLGCIVNGLEFAQMKEGKDVLVIGTGPIGCMTINLCRILGASKIVVVDRNDKRLRMAEPFGADHHVFSENNTFLEEVLALTGGKGYDVVMSACSDVAAHENAILAAAKGGFVNLFGGVAKGQSDKVSFPNNFMHYRQFAVGGSFSQTKEQHKKALAYLASGAIKTKKLITHNFPLDDVVTAIETLKNMDALKVMINP